MSDLVKQYDELSMRLGDEDITDKEEKEVIAKMDELGKQFKASDWDKLIAQSPVFMRPMIQKQKAKYIR